MSWERDTNSYKYESIQHGYEVDYLDDEELEPIEISLEEMLENEQEELELEEMF
jgi:hypothetical protein